MQKRFVGDVVSLTVLRNKELLDLKVSLSCTQDLVPKHIKDRTPPYIVVAGLVFTILSMPFLDCEIEPDLSWQTAELTHLMELASYGERASETQEVVVLAHVLAHRVNLGFDHLSHMQLSQFNGKDVLSLADLAKFLESNSDPYLRFDFQPGGKVIVLEAAAADAATAEICSDSCIPVSAVF